MTGAFRSISLHLALAVAIAIGAILSVTWYAAWRENTASLKSQTDIAQYVTRNVFEELSGKLRLMIFWQDAFDKAVLHWDQKWVDYEFGPYQDSTGISASMLFDRAGHVRLLYTPKNSPALSESAVRGSEGINDLLNAVNAAPHTMPPAIKYGMAEIKGTPYFAVAGRITPETEKQLGTSNDKDVTAIFLIRATADSYRALSETFGITTIEVAPDKKPGRASISLTDATGDGVTRLQWKPDRTGDTFLAIVWPLSGAVLIVLLIVQALVVRRWQALQRNLYRAQSQVEAAEADSRAKTAFLATLSHELRTPLNAIIGFSDLLQRKIFGPLGSPLYDEFVGDIGSGGRNMLKIVNNLLYIAEIETGTLTLIEEAAEIEPIVHNSLNAVRSLAAAKKITLSIESKDRLSTRYSGADVETIFTHILENAVKFTPEGGEVAVSITRRDAMVIVGVRDSGIGIKDSDLEVLCRPFAQVESHLVREHGGLGVGLSIVKGLTHLMGGNFDISSVFGRGTTVTIMLPAADSITERVRVAA